MIPFTIHLPEEQNAALAARAQAYGMSPEEYALQVIQRDLAPEWLQRSWREARESGANRLSIDEIDAEIAAGRKARSILSGQPNR